MGNEQSQQSRLESDSLLAGSDDFNPDNITNTSDSEHEQRLIQTPSRSSEQAKSPFGARRQSSSMKRKEKQKRRKRRPSQDDSILAPESDGVGVAPIPYPREAPVENNALLPQAPPKAQPARHRAHAETEAVTPKHLPQAPISTTGNSDVSVEPERTRDSAPESALILPPQADDGGGRSRYPCPRADQHDCRKTFTILSSARRHAEKAHPEQTFQCTDCSKQYQHIDMLTQHQMSHSMKDNASDHQRELTPSSAALPKETRTRGVEELGDISKGQDTAIQDVGTEDTDTIVNGMVEMIHAPGAGLEISGGNSNRQVDFINEQDTDSDRSKSSEVPAPRKRKRAKHENGKLTTSYILPSKRMRTSPLPPSLASTSNEQDEPAHRAIEERHGTRPVTESRPKSYRSGNLDGFAQTLTPGSQLHHPTLNPQSPRARLRQVQSKICAPATGSSSRKSVASRFHLSSKGQTDSDPLTPLIRGKQQAVYSSNNGKERADPDTEYSSPARKAIMVNGAGSDEVMDHNDNYGGTEIGIEDEAGEDRDSELEQVVPAGMATSVARRTSSNIGPEDLVQHTKERMKRQTKLSIDSEDESGRDMTASPSGDVYLCQECHRKFHSRKALRRHETRPDAHKLVLKCDDCDKFFGSRTMLQQHQQALDHGDGTGFTGRKGPFSGSETQKLVTWRDRFCVEYDLTHVDFNNMMTDSCRRSKGFVWPYRFISKSDFLQEYYDILPNRNRRSMHRYRERAFQNVVSNKQWTAADDKELADLVSELGPKWVEIGLRMSRTQDSVSQRWRHKVQYRGKQKDGEWLQAEADQLVCAVREVKRESGFSFDPHADINMPWESVSKKMKGSRTAQQCSNKWRLLHITRVKGVFLKWPDLDSIKSASSTPVSNITPSKMSQRLAEKRSTSDTSKRPPRRFTSEKYVQESDSESSVEEAPILTDKPDGPAKQATNRKVDINRNIIEEASSSAGPRKKKPRFAENQAFPVNGGEVVLDRQEVDDSGRSHADVADETAGPEVNSAIDDLGDLVDGEAEENPVSLSPMAVRARDEDSDESNHAQDFSSEDEDSDNASPGLPRNPFPVTTPRNHTTLSQAFNQTQANTSAVRAPRASQRMSTQVSRPSPNVVISTRPLQSSLRILSDQENSSDQESSVESSDRRNASQQQSGPSNRQVEGGSLAGRTPSLRSGQETDTSGSSDLEADSDNDTMVQDTRKESFMQSLSRWKAEQQQERHGQVRNVSQSSKRPIDWQRTLRGGTTHDSEGSSDEDDET